MDKELSPEEFLEKKKDFSPYLVHLTKDSKEMSTDGEESTIPAKQILEWILGATTLKTLNHFCLFSRNLKEPQNISLQDKFKVVCFTETPIGQIDVLLNKVRYRKFEPAPYGLVFKKDYIRTKGGNPVFYVTKEIAKPLWVLYWPLCNEDKEQSSEELGKLLALVTLCDETMDWHWEREWRIVGNLQFALTDIFCGLCPEQDISYFENKYEPVTFISPYWGINKILDKLVERKLEQKGGGQI